ncbi:ribosomal protein S18-alanine N-acetyltransferase [Pararhizobium haloflavum]|uniref:ribosomal protein S18-alanine N-acetyltransferase n=1 Tax=Pararhizobium haloflavum TaxID=2037914 RepID=UPI000C1963AE|nr:ribosomal protein S18-alanine N-acetyltransferase [Pararhizobium haloflavum]
MIGGLFSRSSEFDVVPMEEHHYAAAAEIHGMAFARPWSVEEIDALSSQTNVHGFVARPVSGARTVVAGFVLARFAADEAEILTIAVRERFRNRAIGWRLMLAAIRQMRADGAETMFLEVDEANAAAIALYRRLGFRKVAERSAYYKHPGGERTSALVMRLDLR